MSVRGNIYDSETAQPIQGVSVVVVNTQYANTGIGTSTDSNGFFYLSNPIASPPNKLIISHISFHPIDIDIPSDGKVIVDLEKSAKELPGVTLPSTIKKNNSVLWISLAALALLAAKKKTAVGAITTPYGTASNNTETAILVGMGAVAILGFSTLKKIFEGIGFWDSKEEKEVEAEIQNPNSPFTPGFYQAAPAGSMLLTAARCQELLNILTEAFGGFDDDESAAIGVFKTMRTQSQVSFFADYFQKNIWPPGSDLLTWLRGTSYPNDRLSSAEVSTIINYVNRLPKYKV